MLTGTGIHAHFGVALGNFDQWSRSDQPSFGFVISFLVALSKQDYKSLCVVVMICAT